MLGHLTTSVTFKSYMLKTPKNYFNLVNFMAAFNMHQFSEFWFDENKGTQKKLICCRFSE